MNNYEKLSIVENQLTQINSIYKLHNEIKIIDISLEQLYPIGIVFENIIFIFDLDQTSKKYKFIMEFKIEMDIPTNVLAAFPLDFYNNKIAAVVSPNIFENNEKLISLFHEFVHCYQFIKYEMELKNSLIIAKKAIEKQDFLWELNHPFPYSNKDFINWIMELEKGLDISKFHKKMKQILNECDFEYMVWQEWKEGYARYIENLIREKLGFNKNKNCLSKFPFDRVCFYETGSRYMEILVKNDINIKNDLREIFYKIKNCES